MGSRVLRFRCRALLTGPGSVTAGDPDISAASVRPARWGWRAFVRLAVGSVATLAGFAGLLVLLYARSVHDQAGTSDRATVILEGQAMATGHLLLQGWNLTFASYWTSDAPFYALAVRLDGLRPALLYAGPAVMAALVVLVGVFIAREGCRGVPALAGGVAVVALLAFCTPPMALFFVGRGFHVSTVLYALLAFAALRRGRFGPGWVLAVLLLAAGMLGDLLLVAYGAVPLLIAGLVAARAPAKMAERSRVRLGLGRRCGARRARALARRSSGGVHVPAGLVDRARAPDPRESGSRAGLSVRPRRPDERPAPQRRRPVSGFVRCTSWVRSSRVACVLMVASGALFDGASPWHDHDGPRRQARDVEA